MTQIQKKPTPIKVDNLPDTMHELLDKAIDDLSAVEKLTDDYQIDMNHWHDEMYDNKCHVCLAGAAIVNNYNHPKDEFIPWGDMPISLDRKMSALDHLRKNDLAIAYHFFYAEYPSENLGKILKDREESIQITRYEDNSRVFKFQLRFLAKFFKRLGI